MNLGENIYRLRTAKNMSQGDLADALEVSRQSVSKWENNSAVPELDKLVKMAQVFDVSLDTLVNGTDAPGTQNLPSTQKSVLAAKDIVGIILIGFGLLLFCLFIAIPGLDITGGIWFMLLLSTIGIIFIWPLRHFSNILIFLLDCLFLLFLLISGSSDGAMMILPVPFLLVFIIQCCRSLISR